MENIKFRIDGFHCEACIKVAVMKLKKINGVHDVVINDLGGITEIVADRRLEIGEIEKSLEGTDYRIAA